MAKFSRCMRLLLIGLASAPVEAATMDRYLCIADQGTGFRWDGSRWVSASFNVEKDKFLVQQVELRQEFGEKFNFSVKRIGEDKELHSCYRYEAGDYESNRIMCGGLGFGMLIDTKSLRYQETYGLGYIDAKDAPGNTPSITIGKCTKVD